MKLHLYLLLVVLLVATGLSFSCLSHDKVEFGIYLADSGELVLSEEHIKAYYQDAHTIELNEKGIEKWNSYMTYTTIPKLDQCLFSKDFVLKVNGEEIYRGKFYSMASSISYPGIVIMDALFKLDSTHNTICIKNSYPGSFSENHEDPRNDPGIIEYFEKKGLLKDGDPPSHPLDVTPASGPESPPVTTTDNEDQWDDFQGFSAGDNYDGYHLENGSTIYYLKGGMTKVYGPDNELIMNVNDAEVKQVPVPGGKGPQPATHVLRGSYVTGDGFITRVDGLTVVDLSNTYDDKFVDWEAFNGFWRATGGDVTIPESEREPGKIYNYDGYGIKIENDDHAQITFNNEIDQTKVKGIIDEDEIRVSFGSFEATFHFHDETTAFAAFYDGGRAYVKQLTKQRHVSIGTIVGVQVKPQHGEYLTCADGGSSGVVLKSASVETVVSEGEYFNPVAGPQAGKVKPGDLMVVVSGEIENTNSDGPYVAIWAEGYDAEGNTVSWTLDSAHIAGQSQLELGSSEIKPFTLHLSFAETLWVVEINACAYSQPPP
ncbi:MAG: hypothetical protein R6U37_02365 [Dehalococcoidia bacterium]